MPCFAAALLDQCDVAELEASGALGLFLGHAAVDEVGDLLVEVLADAAGARTYAGTLRLITQGLPSQADLQPPAADDGDDGGDDSGGGADDSGKPGSASAR